MGKCFCVVNDLEREVYNGGFDQFFHNTSGDLAVYTVEYLIKLGAMKSARIAKDAVSIFPNGAPSQDQEERWEQMRTIESKSNDFWESGDSIPIMEIASSKTTKNKYTVPGIPARVGELLLSW